MFETTSQFSPCTSRDTRRRSAWHRWRVVLMLLAIMNPLNAVGAGDYAETEKALAGVRKRIEDIRERMGSARTARDIQELKLAEVEVRIGLVARQLRIVQTKLNAQHNTLDRLNAEQNAWRLELADQRQSWARAVRAAYAVGRQSQLKVLLNQELPSSFARIMAYHGYFNRDRVRRIKGMERAVKRLVDVAKSMDLQRSALRLSQSEHAATETRLKGHREERKSLIIHLNREITQADQVLVKLAKDKRALEELLKDLENVLADIPTTTHRQPFARFRGRLAWPASGSIRRSFGSLRAVGELRWQGVLLDAGSGSEVRAVASGRVAFADWLRGFGLLVVVDHGDDYLTLYGHAESLYVETGDWIESGALLATVGDSGGQAEPGLYFAIRHKGRPHNPALWCRPQTNEAARSKERAAG